jgi:hypothetical protein
VVYVHGTRVGNMHISGGSGHFSRSRVPRCTAGTVILIRRDLLAARPGSASSMAARTSRSPIFGSASAHTRRLRNQ